MEHSRKFILLLIITFIILSLYSFSNFTMKVGGVEIKKTKIKEFIIGDTIPTFGELMHERSKAREKVAMDTTSQRILMIGDSMLEQLRWRLRDYCEENGHEMMSLIWYSSQSEYYGTSDTLKYYIKQYKPTFVMMVLGANELFVSDITNKRSTYVKKIVDDMGTTPFVWIGPPNWKDDTGINQLILRHAGKYRYYPSYKITQTPLFKRYNDGAHPKPESAAQWFDSVAVWIMNESEHPILLNLPAKKGTGSPNTVMLQPKK